ncbi:hypothetical protein HJ572_03215 [Pseudomonas aeruginosa]|uniref:hypothetical protein n=1 Tax=Pseudomonas aeruginosa TaxID=287 RepID=UPI0015C7B46A|nr:hypothetical protein [Pseudomonas aeruginosa]MDS9504239.1 hypothetical protein [Pseudomonas aeruginosa]MDS9511005.1 hypothetical protein [Pseudomonas aeruginosa]MDS9530274.1 hypothetical protein [Pseudomonas aeruginosa]MDS9661566.1 hypothetical protein [Pseudomonas aeruginosa]MDS9670453.1 hypothetical protein [Pseudomonas aeruginosa]
MNTQGFSVHAKEPDGWLKAWEVRKDGVPVAHFRYRDCAENYVEDEVCRLDHFARLEEQAKEMRRVRAALAEQAQTPAGYRDIPGVGAATVVDVKEIQVRPFYGRAMLAWLIEEYRHWNSQPGYTASMRAELRNGRQMVRMVAFERRQGE